MLQQESLTNGAPAATQDKIAFHEVSGLTQELSVEEITEGGENRFRYHVPSGAKFENLVVKRGAVPVNSEFIEWITSTTNGDLTNPIEPKNIIIHLMNSEEKTIKTWTFYNAWAVKLAIADLKPERNDLIIESLEFAYIYFTSDEQPGTGT